MGIRGWIAVIAGMVAALVGCQLITGLNGLDPGSSSGGSCSGTLCNGSCVDTTKDPNNCGKCGAMCPSSTMTCSVTGCSDWASWPIPNPVSDAGLPHPASYDNSTSGVVIDKVTGLWWEQPIDGNNSQSKNCSAGCAQADAITYCANLTLAGHSDWRLPTRIELVSIVDYTKSSPAINGTYFPNTPAVAFWTSSPYVPAAGNAWDVYFDDGSTDFDPVANPNRVRCVR